MIPVELKSGKNEQWLGNGSEPGVGKQKQYYYMLVAKRIVTKTRTLSHSL